MPFSTEQSKVHTTFSRDRTDANVMQFHANVARRILVTLPCFPSFFEKSLAQINEIRKNYSLVMYNGIMSKTGWSGQTWGGEPRAWRMPMSEHGGESSIVVIIFSFYSFSILVSAPSCSNWTLTDQSGKSTCHQNTWYTTRFVWNLDSNMMNWEVKCTKIQKLTIQCYSARSLITDLLHEHGQYSTYVHNNYFWVSKNEIKRLSWAL